MFFFDKERDPINFWQKKDEETRSRLGDNIVKRNLYRKT